MFSRSVIVSALMGFAAAQSSLPIAASESLMASATVASGGMATGAASPAGMVNTHIVQVGGANGSLAFFPNNVQAQVGDLVQFQFHPKNHSVVRSTFDNPCVPMNNVQANATGSFFSGFMPTNASLGATANVLTYTVRVTDTKPIWYYCSQGRHCQAGMVGAINAPASGNRTMQSFAALAAQATENLSPGQAPGTGAGNTPPSPSSGAGAGSGSGTQGGAGGSGTGPNPAQQSTSGAPALAQQSFFGLAAAALVAFIIL